MPQNRNHYIAKFLGLIFSVLLPYSVTMAQDPAPTTENFFTKGTEAFKNSDFSASADAFCDVALKQVFNLAVIQNCGISAYKAGRRGLAIAMFRRAQTLNADNSFIQQAWAFARKEMASELFRNRTFWQKYRQTILVPNSQTLFLAIVLVAISFFGFVFLRNLFILRRHPQAEPIQNNLNRGAQWASGVFALIAIAAAISKFYDQTVPYATVVVDMTKLTSSPSPDGNLIFEAKEGQEVVILNQSQGFTFVKIPGLTSGWIENGKILQTSPSWSSQ